MNVVSCQSKSAIPNGIAVIGLAGRFPGADSAEHFWENLVAGRSGVTDVRVGTRRSSLPGHPNFVAKSAVVKDGDWFDAKFFGIYPKQAIDLDPQHRVFLETCWHAMENAGYVPDDAPGRVGVFAGCHMNTYILTRLAADAEFRESLADCFPGGGLNAEISNDKDYLATRVAYQLNLRGPSVAVQSACSTSLVAIAQACESLVAGSCDMAISGGVTLTFPQEQGYLHTEDSILSPDGTCRTFDANAKGTIFGDGVGAVVLKRVSDAIVDRDDIYAVIRGWGVNNDGGDKNGYTAPSVSGQSTTIRLAHQRAGISSDTISYVEAHGTGTLVGDPIEVQALTEAFRDSTDKTQFCRIGSLKTNVGHVVATAPSAVQETPTSPPTTTKHERFGPYKPVRRGVGNGLTEQQQEHLSKFVHRYVQRTAKSRTLAENNRSHFADPRGVAGYRRIWKSMVYQIAGDVAQLLCDFARKDRATFCCTGSEAVMAALRLSRTVTGKSKFVFFNKDYHGNFDQVLVRSNLVGKTRMTSPAAPGVPQIFADNAIVLDYGTPEALQVIKERANEIAAVLIEPVQSANPFLQPKEFLQEIRRITRENKIAMIMDEVITGFRAAQGGAQEWFDVWADLSTYGKILGGGMPIGALAGSREYMDALDGGMWKYDDDAEPEANMTFFAGTFVRHPLAIVAAHQVLTMLKEEGPELQQRLTDRTTHLVQTLNSFFEREQFPIRVAQFASQFRFMFPSDLEYADMLYFHMLDRGVFTRGWGDNCFLSTAHSDADVARVIRAVQESCLEIRQGGFFPDADGLVDASVSEEKNLLVPPSNDSQHASPGLQPHSFLVNSQPISNLVEIQPDDSRTPLFCTPAADGLTMVYHELSDQLGDDQPVYGLNSPGVVGLPIPNTLEELAADMIREMREIQPHGPYLLAGYCSGGTTAMEIARQLIENGEQVAMLAMIETYNWLTAPSTNPTFMTKVSYGYQRVEFHIRNFFLLNGHDKKEFLSSKWEVGRRRVKVWKGAFVGLFSGRKPRKPAARVNMADIWLQHDQIAEKYVPRVYPGRIIHFRPQRDYTCHLGAEVEGIEVEYHRMRAYPAGMMVNPFVAELAESIRRETDRGLAEVGSKRADASNATSYPKCETVGV